MEKNQNPQGERTVTESRALDASRFAMALAKNTLDLVEDIHAKHEQCFQKLKLLMKEMEERCNLPLSNMVEQAKFLSERDFRKFRKEVLDKTNDFKRDMGAV